MAADQQLTDQDAQRGIATHLGPVGEHRTRHLCAHVLHRVEQDVEIGAELVDAGADVAGPDRVDPPTPFVGMSSGSPDHDRASVARASNQDGVRETWLTHSHTLSAGLTVSGTSGSGSDAVRARN